MLTVLPTPAPPNRPIFTALGERHQQVDDLDTGDQQVLPAGLLVVAGRGPMDRQVFLDLHRAAIVLRLAEHVHDTAERAGADRHRDRRTGGLDGQAALQAFRRTHRDRAHDAVAELLLHLERQVRILELECLVDVRHRFARKLHVDDRADDLRDLARHIRCRHVALPLTPRHRCRA
jgi:hypothetical protein